MSQSDWFAHSIERKLKYNEQAYLLAPDWELRFWKMSFSEQLEAAIEAHPFWLSIDFYF